MGGTCSKCKKQNTLLIENICGDCHKSYNKVNLLLYHGNISIQKYLYNSEINIENIKRIIDENIGTQNKTNYFLVYIIPFTNNEVIITNDNIFDFLNNNTIVLHLRKEDENKTWK
jgi:hypothetical protein